MKPETEAVKWKTGEKNKRNSSVTDIAVKEINKGHDFKATLWQILEPGYHKARKIYLKFRVCTLLQPCFQMDIDADDHGEEGIPFSCMDAHIMKMIITEYSVIYPFTGGTVVVNCFIFIRPPGNGSIEPGCPILVLCRNSGHKQRKNTYPYRSRAPSCTDRGQCYLRECFCLQSPRLTMRKPTGHRGVLSLSIEMESGRPRLVLRSIKSRIPYLLQSP